MGLLTVLLVAVPHQWPVMESFLSNQIFDIINGTLTPRNSIRVPRPLPMQI
jgi:hypothetical protein